MSSVYEINANSEPPDLEKIPERYQLHILDPHGCFVASLDIGGIQYDYQHDKDFLWDGIFEYVRDEEVPYPGKESKCTES